MVEHKGTYKYVTPELEHEGKWLYEILYHPPGGLHTRGLYLCYIAGKMVCSANSEDEALFKLGEHPIPLRHIGSFNTEGFERVFGIREERCRSTRQNVLRAYIGDKAIVGGLVSPAGLDEATHLLAMIRGWVEAEVKLANLLLE